MGFIDKIRFFVSQTGDKIRICVFYLGLHLSPPIRLLGLIFTVGLVIWRIFVSGGAIWAIFKIPLTTFTIVLSFLFLAYIIHLMFPPAKRVKIIVDAYGNNPRIIPFIAKKVRRWLENVIDFMKKQPNMKAIESSLDKKYLFSWGNIPGNDSERLLWFLRDDLEIGWTENAKISKSRDGSTINIIKDENSAKIMMDEKNEKVTLKISDGRIDDLKVKTEKGKLNIYDQNGPKKTPKKFLKPSSTKIFEKNGNYLNDLISGVSASFRIPRESLEELINTKVNVNQKIGNEIIVSYDQIEGNINELEDARDKKNNARSQENIDPYNSIIRYCERKIKERTDYLKSREGSLNTQIEWIKELDKRKEAIPTLLEIIKEPSTGKAVSKLSRLLYEKVNTVEDLIWLIRFANSRKGVKISELLGLKIMKGDEMKL